MNKKVLVIEDKDGGFNVVIHKIMKARTIRSARQFIDDYSSPGNLLAEFKVDCMKDCNTVHNDLINRMYDKKTTHVLILGDPKEEEVKK